MSLCSVSPVLTTWTSPTSWIASSAWPQPGRCSGLDRLRHLRSRPHRSRRSMRRGGGSPVHQRGSMTPGTVGGRISLMRSCSVVTRRVYSDKLGSGLRFEKSTIRRSGLASAGCGAGVEALPLERHHETARTQGERRRRSRPRSRSRGLPRRCWCPGSRAGTAGRTTPPDRAAAGTRNGQEVERWDDRHHAHLRMEARGRRP